MEKEQQLDIWSFQWSSNSPSSECVPRPGEHFCVPVCWLIDNKSVSSLIKCPMPVIELHGDARERHNFFLLFTLKVNTKQRHVDTQCWKNIFDISFHEVSQKYALCLRSRQRAFLLPFASSHMFISTKKKETTTMSMIQKSESYKWTVLPARRIKWQTGERVNARYQANQTRRGRNTQKDSQKY